jgi:hypothetical protein
MTSTTSSDGLVDSKTGAVYREAGLDVKRGQVMDVLGNYSCKCYAKSDRGEVVSNEAIVKSACESGICL